jgi:hypothetical protein
MIRCMKLLILLCCGVVAISGYGYNPTSLYVSTLQSQITKKETDLIVFSFDRPLQLYALLESVEKYVKGLSSIQVIYRASDKDFMRAYQEVQNDFQHVFFIAQGDDPRTDFKELTLKALEQYSTPYVLFAVDDIVVTDLIECSLCAAALEQYDAYAFYLRLGKNLDYCYSMDRAQAVPDLQEVDPGIWQWCFRQSECDWAYPNTVDMTLYRKKDVISLFKQMSYWAPNPLEAAWACQAGSVMDRSGLCFTYSKIVNVPLNSVQADWTNRNMELLSARDLLALFLEGKKIAIQPLYRIKNRSAHMPWEPMFIARGAYVGDYLYE